MQAYFDFLAARARNEGRRAYEAGLPCNAPQHVRRYAGNWMEGWEAAALEALQEAVPAAA